MRPRVLSLTCAMLLIAASAHATSFIVPDDAELVAKARAIVVATVEGSYAQETENSIETVYELRLERTLKGSDLPRRDELLRIISPGGVIGDRALYVASAAHFSQGERVLLFLTRDERGRWQTTDLTLGKFRFVTSTAGDRLLVRDAEDVVGWDRNGQVHREQVRREEGFLSFIGARVQKREAASDYMVDSAAVTLPPAQDPPLHRIAANAPFPAATYTGWVSNQPVRWPNMSAGVTFYKRADQNISGVSDGGVAVIQNGLAAWTNECGSLINLRYGGTTNTPSTNFDSVRVVEFNDPQNRISGSWTGSGTIAITFTSFSGTHTFDGRSWLSISDADVVFQNGFPGTHAAFRTAMTHELGHGIGWRHSNQDYATGGACNSANQECTSAAIMNSTVNSSYGYTLQTWDINAAQSVYPGGTCGGGPTCTAPAITSQPQSATITRGASRTLSVTATGTAPLSYQWYTGTSGNTGSPISGATSSSITVTPSTTTSYWVRVTNSCGTANSNTATITVNQPAPGVARKFDFTGDGRADIGVFRRSTGRWIILNSGETQWGQNGDIPVHADYNGDGRYEIAVFRPSNGTWYSNSFNPAQFGQSGDIPVPADYNGDGRDEIAFFRPSNGTWYNAVTGNYGWGQNGDIPVPADYNGDGKDDIAVFRPSTGMWYSNVFQPTQFGQNGDIPVPADYNGDGRDEIAFFRPSNGTWYNAVSGTYGWGQSGDIPVPADYNGDGRADIAVFRPSTGVWYSNVFQPTVFGQSGDVPLPAPFNSRR